MKMDKVNGCMVYEAPHIEIYEVEVEQGYCMSGEYNEAIGGRSEEEGW